MCTLAASILTAQSPQDLADKLPAPVPDASGKKLLLPEVPGAKVELGGADYEQIIDQKGNVARGIEDTPVNVFLRVSKDGQQADSRDYEITIPAEEPQPTGANEKPAVVPAILQWKGGTGEWKPRGEIRVVLHSDKSMKDFITRELEAVSGLPVKVLGKEEVKGDAEWDISLEWTEGSAERKEAQETYQMDITPQHIAVKAGGLQGGIWAVRTLQQILRSHSGSVPCGSILDFPRYSVRGFVFDIARTPFTLTELRNVIDTMSWYKMNDLHLVINNNFIFHEKYVDAQRDPFKESYAAFRLESNRKGPDGKPLSAEDVSYSKKDFAELVRYAKARGVRIVPEFDTPGHALSFTRLRPDLIYGGKMRGHVKRRCEMLDAANPETLKFVADVLDEYLLPQGEKKAVLEDCDVIHVGADEFYGEAEDYRKYTDGLLRYVQSRHHTPRVWGSLSSKPGKTPVLAKGVQLNLWNTGWMKSREAVNLGYDVINTNDAMLYIVPFANYYRADKNLRRLYENWQPNKMYGETLPAGHPQLIGAAFAVWNDTTDLLHNGYGMYDIWSIISDTVNTLSQKMWGPAKAPRSYAQHRELVDAIGNAPGCNPTYAWKHDAEPVNITPGQLPMNTDLPDRGPSYHLTMDLELQEVREGEEQVLLASPVGRLIAVMKDGNIGFRRADAAEFEYSAKLPVGQRVKLELIGTPGNTRLLLDGQEVSSMRLNTYLSIDEGFQHRTKGLVSTFILPLQTIAPSFNGKVYSVRVEEK